MKQIAPAYYGEFQCIAHRCRHSCCIGWEIDIDEQSRKRFAQVTGPLGEKLKANIEDTDDGAHFRLDGAQERCPFLQPDGLCQLICQLGPDSLCQICADHPRYRSEFSDREELGLGLCCEEAARLVLTWEPPTELVVLSDDGQPEDLYEDEALVLQVRRNALAIAQDREFSLTERLENLCDFFGLALPDCSPRQWAQVYRDLERLDEQWTLALDTLGDEPPENTQDSAWDIPFEQLLVYFLYRHLPAALDDGDVHSKLAFAVLSVTLLRWLLHSGSAPTMEKLQDLARMYSGEVEYSDENLYILFDLLTPEEDFSTEYEENEEN